MVISDVGNDMTLKWPSVSPVQGIEVIPVLEILCRYAERNMQWEMGVCKQYLFNWRWASHLLECFRF